jgi:hypothetical protein
MKHKKNRPHLRLSRVLILLLLYPWLVSFSNVDTLRNSVTVGAAVTHYDASSRDCSSSPTSAIPTNLLNAGASIEQRFTPHVGLRADAGVISEGGGGRLLEAPTNSTSQQLGYGKLFLQAQNNFISFMAGAIYWTRSTRDYGTLHLATAVTIGNRDNWFVYAGLFGAPPEVSQAEWINGGIGFNLGQEELTLMAGVASGLYAKPVFTVRSQIPFLDNLYFDVSGSLGLSNYHEFGLAGGVKFFY